MKELLKRHWPKLLLAVALIVGGAGFWVYRTMFHVDPEFQAEQEQLREDKEAFDKAIGIEDDGSFDELEGEFE